MSTAPLLYIFSEDTGSRESCSIFYARYLIVEPPAGGEAEVEKALDYILKRKVVTSPYANSKPWMEPDWTDDDVQQMIGGDNDGIDLLVAALASVGITAWNPVPDTMVDDSSY